MRNLKYSLISLVLCSTFSLAAAPPKKPGAKPAAKSPAAKTPAAAAVPAPAPAATEAPAKMEAASSEQSGTYGMAGCGLGSIIFKGNTTFPQIGAMIFNGIGSQSSAITSGTSNCVASRTEAAAMEPSIFVFANLASLSREAAQGGGEHLNGLAEVLGCHGDEERQRLGQLSQEKYEQIFTENEAKTVLSNYLSAIQADPQLSKTCLTAS